MPKKILPQKKSKIITNAHLHEHLIQVLEQLLIIQKQNKKIMGAQKDAADKLGSFGVQLAKAKDEILAKMQELVDAAANADNVSPELQTAIDNLAAPIQALDDIVPDAPVEPPTV